MRPLYRWPVALGLVLLLGSPAMAQARQAQEASLLMNKSVQQELKVEQGQIDKATEAFQKLDEDNKDLLAKIRDRSLPAKERVEARLKVYDGSRKIVAEILTPEQLKRLQQIHLQRAGVNAFTLTYPPVFPDAQKALNLTDKQKAELKALRAKEVEERYQIIKQGVNNPAEYNEKTEAVLKDKLEAGLKVLTEEQRKTSNELVGKPFKFKSDRLNP
jgi:hypothetical protein